MARDDEEENQLGFKVEDKRRFDATGKSRGAPDADADNPSEEPPAAEKAAAPRTESAGAAGPEAPEAAGAGAEDAHEHGALTFSSFVIGLASQALMFLGLAPDPSSGVVHKDLPQAKGLIDILAMLEEKTRGNLSDDEASMMEEMLYELRMQYVRETRSTPSGKGDNT
jgi:hypothetical protein